MTSKDGWRRSGRSDSQGNNCVEVKGMTRDEAERA